MPSLPRALARACSVVLAAVSVTVVATAPASAAPPSWTSQTLSTQISGGLSPSNPELYGVSCPTASACFAVGTYTHSGSPYQLTEPYVASWNGTTWTQTPVTPPGNGVLADLHSVQCFSTTSCIAVGSYEVIDPSNGTTVRGWASVWNGSTWSVQGPFGQPGGAFYTYLYDLSCTSASACVAVGYSYNGDNSSRGVAYRWDGSSWTGYGEITAPGSPKDESLSRVSCWTATDCVAVGSTSTGTGGSTPFQATLSSSGWATSAPTKPSYATDGAFLTGVACPGTTVAGCIVTGAGQIPFQGNDYDSAFAQKLDGSAAVQLNPDTVNDTSDLSDITCVDTTDCVAVGSYYGSSQQSLVYVLSGGSWQQATVGAPSGSHSSFNLTSVSCAGDLALCTGVSGIDGGLTPYVATNVGSAPVATAAKLAVSAPSTATAGTAFDVTLTAQTSGGSTVSSYSGTKTITFSGPASSPGGTAPTYPATVSFSGGVGTASVTLTRAESVALHATDGSNAGTASSTTVSPAGAASFGVSQPASATAGVPVSVSVTAKDAYGNTATGYAGTVHLTSSDGQAVLPGNGGLSSGTGSFSVTYETAGSRTTTATDTVTSSVTGTSAGATVGPAAVDHLVVTAPASGTAGVSDSITVTAKDTFGNTATSDTDTVHLTSSDSAATLSGDTALVAGVATVHATHTTAGTWTVTATDTAHSAITGTSGGTVVGAAAPTGFVVTAPATATAGSPSSVGVTAKDTFGNTVTGFSGTVSLTSDDPHAVLPASSTLTSGQGTFSVTYETAGSRTTTATSGAVTGTSSATDVSPAATAQLHVSLPASATAGSSVSVSVTAEDAYGNVTPGYSGTVAWTSTDAAATLPADLTLTSGAGSTSVTFDTAGAQTLTGTDTVASAVTGTSGATTVSAAAATHLVVTDAAAATAGSPVSVSVTAKDAFGNVATAYTGTVHWSSTDADAVLPADGTLSAGTGTVSVTFHTAGDRTVTATDAAASSVTGTTGPTTVAAAPASHLVVTAPTTATAGSAVTADVSAEDPFGNVDPAYSGTVAWTSTDAQAVLPAGGTLTAGVGSVQVTYETSGAQTLTGTDAATSTITGTSGTTDVSSAAATHLVLSAPSTTTAGVPVSVSVAAEDAFGNVDPAYAGTLTWSSTDGAASVPGDGTLTAGHATVSVTFDTSGSQTVTTGDGSITGTSGATDVSPAATSQLVVDAPSAATAGTPVDVTVTPEDQFGNATPAFAGSLAWSSSDAQAVLPADGTPQAAAVTLETSGSQTVTVTSGALSGTSGAIAVGSAAASSFDVAAPAAPVTGAVVAVTITARDAYGNVATTYDGVKAVALSGPSDGPDGTAPTLPASTTFSAGVGTASVTFTKVESIAVTATDGAVTGTSPVLDVGVGPLARLVVAGASGTTVAGVPVAYTSQGFDAFGNPLGDLTGGTTFTVANGTCTDASCRVTLATAAGHPDAVTGTDGGVTGTTTLAVTPAPLDHIVVTTGPAGTNGQPISVTVTGIDQFGNPTGDVTPTATLTISPDGTCGPSSCTPATGGMHTISATVPRPGGGSLTTTGSSTTAPGFHAPAFRQAKMHVADKQSTATYVVDTFGAAPLTVTFTATAQGHPTRTATASAASGTVAVTGLTDGVRYTFALTASTPQGTASVVSLNTGVPQRVSKLTLKASPHAVAAGGTVVLTGTLTNGRTPVAGKLVVLTATVDGVTTTVAKTRTGKKGTFRFTRHPSATTAFVATSTAGPRDDPTISRNKPVVVRVTRAV